MTEQKSNCGCNSGERKTQHDHGKHNHESGCCKEQHRHSHGNHKHGDCGCGNRE